MMRRVGAVLLAMMVPVALHAQDRQADGEVERQAMVALRAGQNAQVLTITQPVLDSQAIRDKDDSRLWYCAHSNTEALLYAASGAQLKKAATVLGPEPCDVLFLRAYALTNLKRAAEARDQLAALTRLAPQYSHYAVEYAFAVRAAGDLNAALPLYRHAVELASSTLSGPVAVHDKATALRGIGFILTEQGDLDGAEKSYQESLTVDPDNALAKNELTYIARLRAGAAKKPVEVIAVDRGVSK